MRIQNFGDRMKLLLILKDYDDMITKIKMEA